MSNATEMEVKAQDSVEISVNAKGLWSGKVKVYAEDGHDAYAATLGLAEDLAKLIKKKNGL